MTMHRSPVTLIPLLLLTACDPSGSDTGTSPTTSEETEALDAHLQLFIDTSFPGEMTATSSVYDEVAIYTDTDALALTIAESFTIIDESVDDDTTSEGAAFRTLDGDDDARDAFIAATIAPLLVDGAVVAEVQWTWGRASATTYAIIQPGAGDPGDTDAFFEPVTTAFRRLDDSAPPPAVTDSDSFETAFVDGFGIDAASYKATVECNDGYRCDGGAEGWDRGLGCSADAKAEVGCVRGPPNYCRTTYAFAGTCGFPDVEFDTESFSFKVSGWGWQYYSASGTISCNCAECTP